MRQVHGSRSRRYRFATTHRAGGVTLCDKYMDREAEWGYPIARLRIIDGWELDCSADLDLYDRCSPIPHYDNLLEQLCSIPQSKIQ